MIGEKRPRNAITAASDKPIGGVFGECKYHQAQCGKGEGFKEPMDVFEVRKYRQAGEIK
jgi:hypothetical protein